MATFEVNIVYTKKESWIINDEDDISEAVKRAVANSLEHFQDMGEMEECLEIEGVKRR